MASLSANSGKQKVTGSVIGDQVRAARQAKGWTLRGLARRVPINPGYLSQIERGQRLPSPEILKGLSEVLGVELSAPTPVAADPVPGHLTSDTPRVLAQILAGQRRLEDLTGSAALIAPTTAQLHVITRMTEQAKGRLRRELLEVAAQWAVFTGWLHAATNQYGRAARAFNLAADWALEAGDDTLLSHVYSFKGYTAHRQGNLAAMDGLTLAALRVPRVHPAQRAYNAFQHARALAALGEKHSALQRLDEATRESAAALREGDPPPYGYWYTPAFFKLSIGLAHAWMGNHREANDMITSGLTELPADQRNSEWADEYRAALTSV